MPTDIMPESRMDPTSRGDMEQYLVRCWYERHRETWWERRRRRAECADNFIFDLMAEVARVGALSDHDLWTENGGD